MELIESKTYNNLAKSFAGECQAQIRYMFIEYGAKMEGYKALASIVDKISYNEFNHARMFYTYLQQASNETIDNVDIASGYPFREKWTLLDNLKFAMEDEDDEANRIYPEYRDTAREEGFEDIARLYEMIIEVEKRHKKMFQDLYTQMKEQTMYNKPKAITWHCPDCGYEWTGTEPGDECPLCGAKQGGLTPKMDIKI